MTWIPDIVARGISPRQHHDPEYDEDMRIVTYSGRMAPSSRIAEEWAPEPRTLGDDVSWALWRNRPDKRKLPSWSPAFAAVVSGAAGSIGGTGAEPRWYVLPDLGGAIPDDRFQVKEPSSTSFAFPSWASRFPSGWTGMVNAGTREYIQHDTWHPDFLGLVASNRGLVGYSTKVMDMDRGQLDHSLTAPLSSVFSVEEVTSTRTTALQTGLHVALQLGQTGQGDRNGAGLLNLGWGSGQGKNLLCMSGTVGGPFCTPANLDVQIGEGIGGVPIYPAAMSTDVMWRVVGTGLLGPLEFHGYGPALPLIPALQVNTGSGLVQSRILWSAKPISTSALLGSNLNTPGSWQIWTPVPYITRPQPTPQTGTHTRPKPPVITHGLPGPGGGGPGGGGPGGPGGGGPGGPGGGGPGGPGGGGPGGGGPGGGPGGGGGPLVVNPPGPRRNPLGGFGVPPSGGSGLHAKTQHKNNNRDSLAEKRARLRRKHKENRDRRAERRADREARRADRRARSKRGKKAREAKEERQREKERRREERKQRRKDREERERQERTEKRDAAREREKARRERNREKEEERRRKALERDKNRRKAGQTPGIPLFAIGGGGYNPARSEVFASKIGLLGGMEFIAHAYRRGETDVANTPAAAWNDHAAELLMAAPVIGGMVAYGPNGTGSWAAAEYTDRERSRGTGTVALVPAGYDLIGALRGDGNANLDPPDPVSFLLPSGIAQLDMGSPDPATGKMHTGVRMGADSAGAVSLALIDGNGAATGVDYTIDETGHTFAGKVTVTGRLDRPTTLEFTPTATTSVPGTDYGLWVRTADKALVYSQAGVDTVLGGAALVSSETSDATSAANGNENDFHTATVSAGALGDGDVLKVGADFTGGDGTDGENYSLYLGGSQIAQITLVGFGVGDALVRMKAQITRRAASGAGSARWWVLFEEYAAAGTVKTEYASGASAIDWTAAVAIKTTGQDPAGGAGSAATAHQLLIELSAA